MSDLYFRQADEEGCLFTKIRDEREGRRREVEIKALISCSRSLYEIYAFYETKSAANIFLVSWCFKPRQPQRITSGLKTNLGLSPSYS